MYRYSTKLFHAGVVAVALLALGITLVPSPAWAAKPVKTCAEGDAAACTRDMLELLELHGSKLVFATSTVHSGDLGGVAGADDICQLRASEAGLHGTYRAWIASSSTLDDPLSRFIKDPFPYRLVEGTRVADNWDGLAPEFPGPGNILLNPIVRDEWGRLLTVTDLVWTNVTMTAEYGMINLYDTCQDWTSNINEPGCIGAPPDYIPDECWGPGGDSSAIDSGWTALGSPAARCFELLHLYCFQQ